MKKTSLLKLVAALLITAGAFFTPSILGAQAGAPAGAQYCLPKGYVCGPSYPDRCCAFCRRGVCDGIEP